MSHDKTKQILKDGQINQDPWQFIDLEEHTLAEADSDHVFVPLSQLNALRSQPDKTPAHIGVLVDNDTDIMQLADEFANDQQNLELIALNIPAFADGRAYSQAYLLKTRLGFNGEIRATGEILRDQMFYLHRVGFNAFTTTSDTQTLQHLQQGLNDFTVTYQPSADTATNNIAAV